MEDELVPGSESLHGLQHAAQIAAESAAAQVAQAQAEAEARARANAQAHAQAEAEAHAQIQAQAQAHAEAQAQLEGEEEGHERHIPAEYAHHPHHPHAQLHHPAAHLAPSEHAHHHEEHQGNGGGEPALQAEESLMELPEGADTKRCASCRIVKPVTDYYKDRTHSRGIKTRCKQCLRACKEAFKNQQRAKSAAEQVTVMSKKCSHCGQEKPAADFSRSSYQRTGLRSWCKDCSSKSKKQAKAEGRWKSYDSKAKQPRKCRKCEEVRQPEEFPIDPRNPTKRTRDCVYCLEAAVGGVPAAALAHAPAEAGAAMAMGAWPPHLGEYWHMDPARAQQLQGLATAEAYAHNPPASESLMRILRAAMGGNGDEPRRMTPELLSQLGVYADPNDPFSELPPDAQAAVIQQFVDQHQQRHHTALLQGHPGFPPEALYQRENPQIPSFGGQRPSEAVSQYTEQLQREQQQAHEQAEGLQARLAGHVPPDSRIARPEPSLQQAEGLGHEKDHGQGLGVGHFEQLRNAPYSSEGWQPPAHLQQQLQHHSLPSHPEWPSAFAPTQRHLSGEVAQDSEKREDEEEA